jgi:1-acyl-sn-glycerol-3-phosphate acyltransferase
MPFPLAAPTWPASVERPAPERRTGLAYDHAWARRYPVRLARAMLLDNVTRPVMSLIAPAVVRGREHLAHVEAPMIFVANHASHVDTPLLLSALPADLRHNVVVAAASDYFFDRTWKAALSSFALAAIPIERSRVNRRSADVAAELVEEGWNLLIFPEGGRSPDGWAHEFHGYTAYLARRTDRPVVPVYLHGTRHILPKAPAATPGVRRGSGTTGDAPRGIRRSRVAIVFGRPLIGAPDENARHFATRIEASVATLAEEVRTDWWTARHRPADDLSPLRGPEVAPWRRAWAREAPPAPRTRSWPDS